MLIDTHAHVNFNAFKDDSAEVIRRSLADNVWLINVGSQYSTSRRATAIAEEYEKGVYAAVGLHPIYSEEEFHCERFGKLAKSPKVVAVGEIGLDYKPEYSSFKEKQRTVLCKQMNLARELNLPIIFHCRLAHDDLMKILFKNGSRIEGVVHCFTGNWEQAQKYMEKGFYLGFNGIIFKMDLDDVISKAPLDKILLETDCPYLTPLPAEALMRAGPLRNEPIYVKYIAEKIAKIKNLSYDEIINTTTQNAKKLFKV